MLTPNTVLQGRYLVERKLGQGGMGAVYLATDQRFGSKVALKETLVSGDQLRKAFEREAKLLNTLQHAGLPHVIDHFFEGDGQFLVMQYIAGEDLGAMLTARGTPFPVDDVLRWTDQLLDLLDYLHTQEPPIIHRDIKPENLKLTPRGNVILLDFGLAKGLAEQFTQTTGSVLGYTPNYASLEQIRGTGTDARSDLYSLAATCFHLLTGILPPDAVQRADSFVNGQPDPLRPATELNPLVPQSVAVAVHSAMALRRDDRPPSAAALRAALRPGAQAVSRTELHVAPSPAQPTMTVPVGRPTAPQTPAAGTVPDQQTFVDQGLRGTPETVPVRSIPPSGTGMKVAIGAGAIVGILLLVAVAIIIYVLWPRPLPPPGVSGGGGSPPVTVQPEPAKPPAGSPPVAPKSYEPSAGVVTLTASATSVRPSMGGNSYGADLAVDGDLATAWVEGVPGDGAGEALTVRLSQSSQVKSIRVAPGYFKSPKIWVSNNRLWHVTIELSDGRRIPATFDGMMHEQSVAIGGGPVAWIRIVIDDVYHGGDSLDTAISEVEVVTDE